MFRPSRTQRSAAWLQARMALFVAGAACGLAGMLADRTWLINIGIGLLIVGLLLRFLPERENPSDGVPHED